jgi:hypothetical protein
MRKFLTSGRRRYALLVFVVGVGSLALMGASCQPTNPPAPPPGLTIAPSGNVFETTSEVQQFVVTNNRGTTGTLTTSILNEPGTNPGDFTANPDNCDGSTLAGGNVCTLDIHLNATGQKAATLRVADANSAAVAIVGGVAP